MLRRTTSAWLVPFLLLALPQSVSAGPKVVVTIKPLYALVAGVMAGVGRPQMLVKGPASPHLYALKPSDLAAINGADLVFRASAATEPFSARLSQTLPRQVELVTLQEAPGVVLFERRTSVAFETSGDGHRHPHGAARANAFDGHIWLDPDNAKAMVDRIEQALSAKDPDNAAAFKANATALQAQLDSLGAELKAALEPLAGKPYIVAHDAFQYLERRYGLNVVGAISISPEVPPSAKRLSELRQKILALGAICVFAE